MKSLYQSPLRVYLALLALAACGVMAGLQLPVSLFPNSSKPEVNIRVRYSDLTAEQFHETYGEKFEYQLQTVSFDGHEVERVEAHYRADDVFYKVEFQWLTPPEEALREVTTVANAYATQFPKDIRDGMGIWSSAENSGFLAISFYSSKRSLDDLYKFLDPILVPPLAAVKDAEEKELWNPERKEVRVQLIPEKMAVLQIYPQDVQMAVERSLEEGSGGTLNMGLDQYSIRLAKTTESLQDLGLTVVSSRSGRAVYLREIANIEYAPMTQHAHIMKTSGQSSLILWVTPRVGGNVKSMSEQVIAMVDEAAKNFPADIQYKVLVDPSEFIRSAVKNVVHEVFLAAFLAVIVLFLFLGNAKNVMTAAVEIPMSIVLAFIMMKFSGINLNLISLGGLALSAGMNVDASVVVMENIFRHFARHKGPLDRATRLKLTLTAVNEVKLPIVASTIASLVVFVPLVFTQGLASALLGDLAWAVIYSHGISAFVALILVPTVRLHILNHTGAAAHAEKPAPLDGVLNFLESWYGRSLQFFIRSRVLKAAVLGGLVLLLVVLVGLTLPRIQKEIIGRPDTDWIVVSLGTDGNTLIRQMEEVAAEAEDKLLKVHGDKILYTFSQIRGPNQSSIMLRLRNKADMNEMWKTLEAQYTNTPDMWYNVEPWNPSELPIPNPPHMEMEIFGQDHVAARRVAQDIRYLLQSKRLYNDINSWPNLSHKDEIKLSLNREQWAEIQRQDFKLSPQDLTDITRVATDGREIGRMTVDNRRSDIRLYYPEDRVKTLEDLSSLPVSVKGKLVPLRAFMKFSREEAPAAIFREDGLRLNKVTGRLKKEDESKADDAVATTSAIVQEYVKTHDLAGVSVQMKDAKEELNTSLKQLGWAIALSIFLIFFTMVFQFGDVVSALLVLVAIPLGFIGVILSLFIFGSTVSLNSALGVILLNGISVANSIILVDYLRRLVSGGLSPYEAAIKASTRRLRPILMTSITTLLGMLPIALGLGEGGRILQPLGIAVAGGLVISTMFTLYIVPTLQCGYLELRAFRNPPQPRASVASEQSVKSSHSLSVDFEETL